MLPLRATFANSMPLYLGSVYLLLFIAAAELKSQLFKSTGQFAWQVASALRDPNPGTLILRGKAAYSHPLIHGQKKLLWATISSRR